MTSPTIILIRPQMGENIGAVARAMKNFGLSELRIVAPRDGWPNEKARDMAVMAADIIDNAKLFETLAEAVADVNYLYATSARSERNMRKSHFAPREAVATMNQQLLENKKIAVLFGPERTGLINEDVAICDAILTIPTDPVHSSLNIAQSAVILGYEWWIAQEHMKAAQAANEEEQPATREELLGYFDALEEALDQTYFFKSEAKKPRTWRNLRATFLRAALSSQEVHTLRGMLVALTKRD